MRNPFIPKRESNKGFTQPEHQSAGILDDFAVRKVVSTREGTIEKVPINNSDITNKNYVDTTATNYWEYPPTTAVSGYDTIDNMAYEATGLLTGARYKKGNEVLAEITVSYDANSNPEVITVLKDGVTYTSTFTYTYDGDYRVLTISRVNT